MGDTDIEARTRAKAHEVCALLDSWCRENGNGNPHSAVCDVHADLLASHERELVEVRRASEVRIAVLSAAAGTASVLEAERDILIAQLNKSTDGLKRGLELIRGRDAQIDAITASLASMTVERDEAVAKLAATVCRNAPCPVCGGGPSGEWTDGSEVDCDDCGTALYVDSITECKGTSTFSLADARCAPCKGRGFVGDDDEEPAPDCAKCKGAGRREPTLAEARAAAGIETPKESE